MAYRLFGYLRPVFGADARASLPNAPTVRFRRWVDARVARRVARPEDAQITDPTRPATTSEARNGGSRRT